MENIIVKILILISVAGLLTHLFVTNANGEVTFFVVGLLIPPIGAIHGIYLWF
jgi:hypothetical protein